MHEFDSGEGPSIAASVDPLQCNHADGILQYCGVRLPLEARMVEHQAQGAHSSGEQFATDCIFHKAAAAANGAFCTTPRHGEGMIGWNLVKAVLTHGKLCIQLERSRAQPSHGMLSFRATEERHVR